MDLVTTEVLEKPKKITKRDYVYATGRCKEAIARVRLYAHIKADLKWGENLINKEQLLVNQKPIEHYFSGPVAKALYSKPLLLTNTVNKFAITISVAGGGSNGQLDAAVFGIARALSALDKTKYRSILKTNGLLSRDARVRERRKVGTGGKARRQKQSPKR